MDNTAGLYHQLREDILKYKAESAARTAQAIVDAGLDIMEAVKVATAAITQIGDQFERAEIYLPELMLAGETMRQCMAILSARMTNAGAQGKRGKVVIGAVTGDIHDIGKNLVATQLSVRGFDVVDLGVNVAPMQFVEVAQHEKADIIALSALMTTSMWYQKDVLSILSEMHLRQRYYVVIGGGPTSPEFARQIGADGWGGNAVAASRVCEQLVRGGQRPPLANPILAE